MDVNIFTRIGFVVLVGLASKNAILIVEFAKQQRLAGASRREATLAACQLRLRPIVMTSFAFILGVVPLMLATGAAAEMRRALGTAVFSGMLGVTLFGLVLTPVFFFSIDWLCESRFFSSRPVRALGEAAMLALSPMTMWRVFSLIWQEVAAAVRRAPSRSSPPQVNVEIVVVEPEVVVESDDVPVLPDASTNGGETSPGRRSYRQHPN
jgi:multidrug efflux pump